MCADVKVKTNLQAPINEFTNRIFVNAFPYHFLLGIGDGEKTSDSLPGHLLLWHDQRFATHDRFIFYSYDLLRRWAVARGVSCRVKGDRSSVEQFSELVSEPDFDKKLEAAIEKPNAAESSRLMQRV